MAEQHHLYNGGSISVNVDEDGHHLDAGERTTGDPGSPIVAPLLDAGLLTDLGPVKTRATRAASTKVD